MDTENKTWWQRFKESINPAADPLEHKELPKVGTDGLLVDGPEQKADEEPGDKAGSPLTRWTKRDQAVIRLQEDYERLRQLITDMQQHMTNQSERTERICTAMEQLNKSMADTPQTARQQVESLEAVVGQLETLNTRNQQLASAMQEVPRAARSQADSLTGIKGQLEMLAEQQVVGTQTMEKVGSAIHSVNATSGAQAEVLKQMYARTEEQNERLNDLIAQGNRRFVILFVVTVLLAVAAIGVIVFGMLQKSQ